MKNKKIISEGVRCGEGRTLAERGGG